MYKPGIVGIVLVLTLLPIVGASISGYAVDSTSTESKGGLWNLIDFIKGVLPTGSTSAIGKKRVGRALECDQALYAENYQCHGHYGKWVVYGLTCLLFSEKGVKKKWDTARKFCTKQDVMAKLAVFNTVPEYKAFAKAQLPKVGTAWIGLKEGGGINPWKWLNEKTIEDDDPGWAKGEPEGGYDENCALATAGGWKSVACKEAQNFVCQIYLDAGEQNLDRKIEFGELDLADLIIGTEVTLTCTDLTPGNFSFCFITLEKDKSKVVQCNNPSKDAPDGENTTIEYFERSSACFRRTTYVTTFTAEKTLDEKKIGCCRYNGGKFLSTLYDSCQLSGYIKTRLGPLKPKIYTEFEKDKYRSKVGELFNVTCEGTLGDGRVAVVAAVKADGPIWWATMDTSKQHTEHQESKLEKNFTEIDTKTTDRGNYLMFKISVAMNPLLQTASFACFTYDATESLKTANEETLQEDPLSAWSKRMVLAFIKYPPDLSTSMTRVHGRPFLVAECASRTGKSGIMTWMLIKGTEILDSIYVNNDQGKKGMRAGYITAGNFSVDFQNEKGAKVSSRVTVNLSKLRVAASVVCFSYVPVGKYKPDEEDTGRMVENLVPEPLNQKPTVSHKVHKTAKENILTAHCSALVGAVGIMTWALFVDLKTVVTVQVQTDETKVTEMLVVENITLTQNVTAGPHIHSQAVLDVALLTGEAILACYSYKFTGNYNPNITNEYRAVIKVPLSDEAKVAAGEAGDGEGFKAKYITVAALALILLLVVLGIVAMPGAKKNQAVAEAQNAPNGQGQAAPAEGEYAAGEGGAVGAEDQSSQMQDQKTGFDEEEEEEEDEEDDEDDEDDDDEDDDDDDDDE